MQQRRFTKEFEEEAVRLVQTSGRTQREIAGDLGIGLSTLVRWMKWKSGSACCRPNDGGRGRCHGRAETAAPGERDPPPGAGHPEEGDGFFAPGGKSMRFALIDTAKAEFPIHRLCGVLGVSQSGYFAWRGRPACRRQRDDMVLLAHVRSAFYAVERHLWQPPDDAGIAGQRPHRRSPPDGASDAGERAQGSTEAAV